MWRFFYEYFYVGWNVVGNFIVLDLWIICGLQDNIFVRYIEILCSVVDFGIDTIFVVVGVGLWIY